LNYETWFENFKQKLQSILQENYHSRFVVVEGPILRMIRKRFDNAGNIGGYIPIYPARGFITITDKSPNCEFSVNIKAILDLDILYLDLRSINQNGFNNPLRIEIPERLKFIVPFGVYQEERHLKNNIKSMEEGSDFIPGYLHSDSLRSINDDKR